MKFLYSVAILLVVTVIHVNATTKFIIGSRCPQASVDECKRLYTGAQYSFNVPIAGDCSVFCQCDDAGNGIVMPCAPGTLYTLKTRWCTPNTPCDNN